MKSLLKRLSKVSDSSNYSLLRSESKSLQRKTASFRFGKRDIATVPGGHIPVYVGDEMERFVVNAKLLNHPIFVKLLNKSAQEYGYEQQGVLRIPCHVYLFERFLEVVRFGQNRSSDDLQDLIHSLSDSFEWTS